MFDGKFYDQSDGVSMGSPLGPILANIFMSNLETVALNNYLGTLPLIYRRYVDDCFLLFGTKAQCNVFFEYLNKQHPNIKFTKEVEQDQSLPFLDIKINQNQDGTLTTSVFRKPTYSGLYLNWRSYVPKQYKLGLVRCLLHRAWSICSSSELFESEVSFIRSILRANGYPLNFLNSCIIKFKKMKHNDIVPDSGVQFGPKLKDVYINLPFKGEQSSKIKKQLSRLFSRMAPWIKLNFLSHASNKLSKLSKLKSVLPIVKCSHLIYHISCSECDEFYIGLTNRRLKTRIYEPKTNENSALFKHSFLTDHVINYSNPKILTRDNNSFRLQIKETLKIKEFCAHKSLNGNMGSFKLSLW